MRRKLIITAAIIVVLGALAGLIYFFSGDDSGLSVGDPFSGIGSGNVSPSADLPTDGLLSNAGSLVAPRLIRITDGPVALGSVAFNIQLPMEGAVPVVVSTTSTSTPSIVATTTPDVEVRFIDRASGNVYAYTAHARTLTRISNKTLPGVQEASWVADGSRAYARFLANSGGFDRIDTFALNANGEGGYLLEQNLAQATVSGTNALFTLFSGTTGSVGSIGNADGSNQTTLFSSLISALIVHPTSGNLYATNKASSQVDGYGFEINRNSGAFSRILGPFRGLTLLPSLSGSSLIFSYTDGGIYRLRLFNTATRSVIALPVATLSEKCVWDPNGISVYCAVPVAMQGNLPDDWYQGAVRFTDRIWRIDVDQRVASLIVDPNEIGALSIDAVALTIDPEQDMLIFTDKQSGALYAYDL